MTGFLLNTLKILFTRLFRILLGLSKSIPSEAVKFRSICLVILGVFLKLNGLQCYFPKN